MNTGISQRRPCEKIASAIANRKPTSTEAKTSTRCSSSGET
jgi:hypothetical protein